MTAGAFGPKNSRAAKLTAGQVIAIREQYAAGGCTQADLCRHYGVSVIQIGRIINGQSWQKLPMAPKTAADAAASQARLLEMLRREQPEAIPVSIEPSAIERLSADIAQKRADDHKADGWLSELASGTPKPLFDE